MAEMKINKTKYFVEIVDWIGSKASGRMLLANDGSCVNFQRSPASYSCKCRPTKPVNDMTDEELLEFYKVARVEHDEAIASFAQALSRRKKGEVLDGRD